MGGGTGVTMTDREIQDVFPSGLRGNRRRRDRGGGGSGGGDGSGHRQLQKRRKKGSETLFVIYFRLEWT